MAMDGQWMANAGREDKYQYNGKELHDDFGLGWYAYGARWYMPDIGRWGQVDPLTEKYANLSAYNYVANNPLKFIDPDGRNGVLAIDKEAGKVTVTANFHWSARTGEAFAANGRANDFVSNASWQEYIQDNWGGTHSVEIDGRTYEVTYDINIVNHDTHEEAIQAWKADPSSNFLFVREGQGGGPSHYAADGSVLTLNSKQQKNGDGKTFSHEAGHALGLGHNTYKDENGTSSISSYDFGKRNVIGKDVINTINGAIQLANQTEGNNVRVILQTSDFSNTVKVVNANGTYGKSLTYNKVDGQK